MVVKNRPLSSNPSHKQRHLRNKSLNVTSQPGCNKQFMLNQKTKEDLMASLEDFQALRSSAQVLQASDSQSTTGPGGVAASSKRINYNTLLLSTIDQFNLSKERQ